MTTFLTGDELASYLDAPLDGAIDNVVKRVNALVTQEWANPTTVVPEWVKNVAWNVAIRAASNPKGVTSKTRSWDDMTTTERWEAGAAGVTLTDEEKTLLTGAAGTVGQATSSVKSIRMNVPGWSNPVGFPRYDDPWY
jgi:hypothetical protein